MATHAANMIEFRIPSLGTDLEVGILTEWHIKAGDVVIRANVVAGDRGEHKVPSNLADPATIDPAAPLREQVEMDSIDAMNFLIAIHRELGIDIPERDYPKLRTLDDLTEYILARARGDSRV